MADPIKYTRTTFQHVDWTDNVSRVQADGADGFNIRFHALEAEFDQISKVFDLVNAALVALGQKPPPKQIKITLTPVLETTALNGWSHQQGLAQKPPGQTSAQGMMSVDLPDGVELLTLRVNGRNSGTGTLSISLQRQSLGTGNNPSEQVVTVSGSGNPFDASAPANAQVATVDTSNFKYFIVAEVDNAQAADIVQLTAFQITYQSQ